MNYFELFQLESVFDIDTETLKSNYQKLQRLTHPDKFANASDAQKRIVMQKNAQINDAFHVLSSPILRAEHLLTLRNFQLADANASMSDNEFLMTQMELRESMAVADGRHDLEQILNSIKDEQSAIVKTISENLVQEQDAGNQRAALALTKLKFFTKIRTEVEEKLLHT